MWLATVPAGSLVPVAPCGLPVGLACRRLWRLGYRRGAWMTGIGLGAVTVVGLLAPVAIAIYAVVLSVPVWIARYWLVRRG